MKQILKEKVPDVTDLNTGKIKIDVRRNMSQAQLNGEVPLRDPPQGIESVR